ncbi:MAG: phenylacetate--CoA ligase family protein [Candidatus Binatia bacterium]
MKKGHERVYPDRQDTWPEERLKKLQFRRVKRVLRHAYQNLPFYRRRFDAASIHPDSVRSFQDLFMVPTFTKRDVLQEIKESGSFITGMEMQDSTESAVLCMTSGTLGSSFLYLPKRWCSIRGDSLIRAYWWGGLRSGMRMLMAAPAWHSLAVQETRVMERLGATCVVPWGTFLPRYSGNFLDTIIEIRPDFVSIFLPMLYALLAECRRRRIGPRQAFSSVKYLLIVGAPMTPRSREKLREELGVLDIFEGLGNPEGLTAMECSFHCGHHIFVDCCYVEINDPKTGHLLPAGNRGTVVITSLIPYGSLYIRYDTEDLGEILPRSCECGRTWPLLEVYDRRANVVQVAGKEIVPYDVRLCLEEVPEFIGVPFALVRGERSMDYLRLVIQKTSAGNLNRMGTHLRALLKEKLQVEAREEWTEGLPERWKGVTVIEEKDWGAPRV